MVSEVDLLDWRTDFILGQSFGRSTIAKVCKERTVSEVVRRSRQDWMSNR